MYGMCRYHALFTAIEVRYYHQGCERMKLFSPDLHRGIAEITPVMARAVDHCGAAIGGTSSFLRFLHAPSYQAP